MVVERAGALQDEERPPPRVILATITIRKRESLSKLQYHSSRALNQIPCANDIFWSCRLALFFFVSACVEDLAGYSGILGCNTGDVLECRTCYLSTDLYM